MLRQRFVNSVPSLHHEHDSYKWWVLANIMISGFMVVLDSTIVNTALPKIMASFGISVDVAQWILTGYMLAFAVMLPCSGWMADRFGYKRTYAVGLAVFTLFSFLCGISWNENSLIVMRIGQGMGGGLLQPLGMAIIMREFPPEKRGLAMGFWSISAAASVSLGPMFGGYIADNFDWHLIFNINVPVGIICFFATWIIQREYKTQQARSFDFTGFFSLSVFLGFLLFALASGNAQWNTGGWTSDPMMLCYFLAAGGICGFHCYRVQREESVGPAGTSCQIQLRPYQHRYVHVRGRHVRQCVSHSRVPPEYPRLYGVGIRHGAAAHRNHPGGYRTDCRVFFR